MNDEKFQLIDELIELELQLEELYKYFSTIFPEDKLFWSELAQEESQHAKYIQMHSKELPPKLLDQDFDGIRATVDDIKENLLKYRRNPPSIYTALNLAHLLEKTSGEAHYAMVLKSKIKSTRVNLFKILNSSDDEHINKINKYIELKSK